MCIYICLGMVKVMLIGGDDRKTGGVKGLSNGLMQLRKICQHPFLFDSVKDKVNPTGLVDDKLVRSLGKLELLSRILPKFSATDHRVGLVINREGIY